MHPPLPVLQTLPRPSAHLCLRVRDFVRDVGVDMRGRSVLLAVSGGADSLALLCIMSALRVQMGHSLHIVHIDHGLRPESAAEARTVAALCAAWNLPCRVRKAPVRAYAQGGTGLEEAGRILRYTILKVEREQCKADWICTGHHSGDLAEDILLRLMRGAAWPALGGMPAVDARRHILRPLLLCAPHALRTLVQDCGLAWSEDPSNADTRFVRNSMRHRIVPVLCEHNPAFLEQCCAVWQRAQDDAQHWEHILNHLWQKYDVMRVGTTCTLPYALLHSVDRATRLRCYVRALREVTNSQVILQLRHDILYRLDAAWLAHRSGSIVQFPHGLSATVRKGAVIVSAARRPSAAHARGAIPDVCAE